MGRVKQLRTNQLDQLKQVKEKLSRFMAIHKFALKELETKVDILKEEFQLIHEYNPIEHTKSRLKSPEKIIEKLYRKGLPISFSSIRNNIRDVAGLRITCSFISDIYHLYDMLSYQKDLTVLETKDYIKQPKPNGYQSLHMIVEVPVFMSDRTEMVCVEIQIRTIAMDFWASLEHKIFYKCDRDVPKQLLKDLKNAAEAASQLDREMERLHREIASIRTSNDEESESELMKLITQNHMFNLPVGIMNFLNDDE
jgi:putative GTP pyrophosphokinase